MGRKLHQPQQQLLPPTPEAPPEAPVFVQAPEVYRPYELDSGIPILQCNVPGKESNPFQPIGPAEVFDGVFNFAYDTREEFTPHASYMTNLADVYTFKDRLYVLYVKGRCLVPITMCSCPPREPGLFCYWWKVAEGLQHSSM